MTQVNDGRLRVSSGGPFEAMAGYCRALRVGELVFVAGTTSYKDGEIYGVGDAAAQTRQVLALIEGALREAGSRMEDVVRYRVFVTDIQSTQAIIAELGRVFGAIRPVATLVAVSALVHPDLLVEIEVDAVTAGR